jgi:hypothetical protein
MSENDDPGTQKVSSSSSKTPKGNAQGPNPGPEANPQMSALVPLLWFAIPFLALIVYGVITTWL